MNYEYIEDLVSKSKSGDMTSKEKLMQEFKPLILNISKRTFINGYDNHDIQNECYKILFKCLLLYNLQNHRFVAYATNGIKNSINDLIRKSKNRSSAEGSEALILCDNLEHTLPSDLGSLEDDLCAKCDYESVKLSFLKLNEEERESIDFIFLKGNSVGTYAYWKNLSNSTASQRKRRTLKKLNKYMHENNYF